MDIRPDRKLGVACAALTACAVAVAGCGGGSAGPLSASAAARLRHDVAMVRGAVGAREQAVALARIESLRGDISRLEGSGRLARTDATVLQQDAAHLRASVESRLRPVATNVSTTTASTTTTPPVAPAGSSGATTPPAGPTSPPGNGGGPAHPGGAPPGHAKGHGPHGPGPQGNGQSNGAAGAGALPLINALIHGNGWGYLKHLVGSAYRGEIARLARAQDWRSLERLLQQNGWSGSGGGDGSY